MQTPSMRELEMVSSKLRALLISGLLDRGLQELPQEKTGRIPSVSPADMKMTLTRVMDCECSLTHSIPLCLTHLDPQHVHRLGWKRSQGDQGCTQECMFSTYPFLDAQS